MGVPRESREGATTKTGGVVGAAMSDDEPAVPVHCPECETTTRIAISELGESVERHNERMHDGEDIAHVDEAIVKELQDLVAKDLDLL